MNPEPFRIEPTFSPRIWGARSLAPIFPEKTALDEPIGEAWLTDVRCRVANGAFAGRCLGEAWAQMPSEWRGERSSAKRDFPLLMKFIFPNDKLSIQVHPDDAYARAHEHETACGKTEMWHVVSAKPGSELLLGLKPGATREEFGAAMTSSKLERLFQTHLVEAGETFFIPAGTPHTIGPGMILCEVQQYSDLTYRVYDYGRLDAHGKPRELHIRKALEVIRFDNERIESVPPVARGAADEGVSLVAACRYFATERLKVAGRLRAKPDASSFQLLTTLSGRGEIRWASGVAPYRQGECWFAPASVKEYEILPEEESDFLRAYVPDLDKLRRDLRRAGAADSQIAKAVFE